MNEHGYSKNLPIGRAINKYGWDNFQHTVLFSGLSENDAKMMEKTLIRELHTNVSEFGYNITDGGDGVCGYKHTQEAREKMSLAMRGDKHPNYGKHIPQRTRQKIAEKLTGNKNPLGAVRSSETRAKMSRSKEKPVSMYDDNGVLLRTFRSAKAAQEETSISRKNISLCCGNQRKHAGGYVWKFA